MNFDDIFKIKFFRNADDLKEDGICEVRYGDAMAVFLACENQIAQLEEKLRNTKNLIIYCVKELESREIGSDELAKCSLYQWLYENKDQLNDTK